MLRSKRVMEKGHPHTEEDFVIIYVDQAWQILVDRFPKLSNVHLLYNFPRAVEAAIHR